MNFFLYLGLFGCLLGLMTGAAGTYLAISSARGPKERAFMIRGALVCWAVVGGYWAALFLVPGRWPWIWMAHAVALPIGLRYWSVRQTRVRRWEQALLRRRLGSAAAKPDSMLD